MTHPFPADPAVTAAGTPFAALVERSPDVVLLLSEEGTIRYANAALAVVAGGVEAVPRGYALRDLVHPEDVEATERLVPRVLADPHGRAIRVLRLQGHDGRWLHMEVIATDLGPAGAQARVLVNGRDVSERIDLEQRLNHEALHDALTGLANRTLFRERVALALAAPPNGTTAAVVLLDLDQFKGINDTRGHGEGDELLRAVAARLLNATRGSDTVARLGGDEFAVLLTGVRDTPDVQPVLERIEAALRRPIPLGGGDVATSASIGVALSAGGSVEEILRDADVAMYAAKAGGRGTHRYFEPAMHAAVLDRAFLETELRTALETGGLEVAYQPLVDLATGATYGVEALARWTHPAKGPIPPSRFIPVAEETGMVVALGRWVLREACGRVAGWQRLIGAERPLSVSVNVSGRQLLDDGFVGDVAAALRDSGLRPGTLVLEITEGTLVQNSAAVLSCLSALKELGVRLAIDDFGTGYSSLAYLRAFPVDMLKIDRRFVDDLSGSGTSSAFARAVLSLGATLGLPTVAEGVETQMQLDELRALGCEFGQGYIFERPLSVAQADEFFQRPHWPGMPIPST